MTEGMDAHLTKPLLARHLHETLDRLTSRCEQSSGRDVVAPANGDQTGYRTNAEPFSEQSGEYLSSIDMALDRNDAPELVTANTLSGFLVGLLEASTTGQAFTPEEASGEADWAPAWEAFEAPATESPEPDARTPALHKDSNPSSVAAPWAPRGCE